MLNPVPEMMKGVTDIPIALIAIVLGVLLLKNSGNEWAYLYFLIGGSAIIGAAVHMFRMSVTANKIVWMFLYIMLYEIIRRFSLLMSRYIEGTAVKEKPYVYAVELVLFAGTLAVMFLTDFTNDILILVAFMVLMVVRVIISLVKAKRTPHELPKAYLLMELLLIPIALQWLAAYIPYAVVAEHIVIAAALFIGYLIGKEAKPYKIIK